MKTGIDERGQSRGVMEVAECASREKQGYPFARTGARDAYVPSTDTEPASQENVEIHCRLMERVVAGDTEGELELIHPDIKLYNRPDAMEVDLVCGREGYRRIIAEMNEHFDKWRFEVEEYIDAGEYLVVVGRPRGVGRLSGVKLEDLDAYSDPDVSVWRFRGGMIIEYRGGRTKHEALEAAGLREQARIRPDGGSADGPRVTSSPPTGLGSPCS